MYKNTALVSIVFAILLAVGVVFIVRSQSEIVLTGQPNRDTTTGKTTTSETTKKQSLKDLMSLGINQQCTFHDETSGSFGSVYTANGKYRSDFTSTVNGKTIVTHMFSDGQDTYMWMDDEKSGFKMSMAALENTNTTANTVVPKTVDIQKQVDYSCVPWKMQAETFDLPGDVEFTDFGSVMEKMIPTLGATTDNGKTKMEAPAAGCSLCDSLSADAKSQCKTALNCS